MISIKNLQFQYPRADFSLQLSDLEVAAGEKVAFVGPSGCGKTTLLNLIAGIVTPDSGSVVTAGANVGLMSGAQRRDFRISNIGLVFQQFELIDYLDLKANILLPFAINRSLKHSKEIEARAIGLAQEMGLGSKLKRFPGQLSQGEKQRCAICRALITEPRLILADEPTGNLDPKNKLAIMDLMFQQAERFGQTLVMVTHDMSILGGMDRTIDFEQFRRDTDDVPANVSETTEASS
ncbi:ABC transporter ATP-binding protein [Mariniblastus sp.]|nr:ABC transporter ATP-binding protein [Mariniblastus sp.]